MYCIIVERGQFQRQASLQKMFYATTPVLWDRRLQCRRRDDSTFTGDDRRQRERRGTPPVSWKALGFVVVDGN